ncbi:glycosyl hydrolase [Podospora fimiseda]|uniref:Glycosyl hydrolase n=1 Tax=Podospora fimiseda TaxID=252190 RepID=A0AAN7BDM8_9PEZI|nr:glycosyl hydrolase [Podospora fimiseda]
MKPLLPFLSTLSLTSAATFTNPIIWQDHPDLDVFRINDTFYYSSSTFAYSPGAPVLRSYDLANWEPVSHSVPTLNFGSQYNLANNQRAYVKGIWASTLRYSSRRDRFYWLGCVDGKTYVWIHNGLNKEWNWQAKGTVQGAGCYYDAGMLVDDESSGEIFVAYGNKEIRVAQLTDDGSGNLKETRNQVVYNSGSETVEGARMYKIKGHSPWGSYTKRSLVEKISGPLANAGFAHQGGVVDTQDGRWYYMGFLDAYPGGRIPVLAPMTWSGDGWPSVVVDGNRGWGREYPMPVNTTRAVKGMLGVVEEFKGAKLGEGWEWNHNPDGGKWSLDSNGGGLVLKTAAVTGDLFAARNTLTHRIVGPKSRGTFRIDVSKMADGDRAGAVLFRDQAGYIGIHKSGNTASIVVVNGLNLVEGQWTTSSTGKVAATGPSVTASEVWFRVQADITPAFGTNIGRQAVFSYSLDGKTFTNLGPALSMTNSWRYFTGYRYGVFNFATKSLGGEVKVKSFSMELV